MEDNEKNINETNNEDSQNKESSYSPRTKQNSENQASHDDNDSRGEYTPRDENSSRGEYTPRGENSSRGEYTPRGENSSRGEYTPRGENSSRGEYTPRGENSSRGEYTPRGDYDNRKAPQRYNKDKSEGYDRRNEFSKDRDLRKSKFKKYDKIAVKKLEIDYKKPEILQEFLTEKGKILSRIITGCSRQNQQKLTREVKRARYIGFLPNA